jgi:putative ABC transport system permease protein
MLLKLLFRNATRHKLRTGLTVLGICVAILAFGMLRTLIDAWYAGVDASSAARLVTRNAISLIFPLPIGYKEKIRSVEGVRMVSYGNWFGGIYISEKNFFANFAVEAESYLTLYPEFVLNPREKQEFLRDRKGCVVGRKLAERFGWAVGDTVPLKGTIFPGNWDFVVRAIYTAREPGFDEHQFFFHWDYLNETLRQTNPRRVDQVGFYTILLENPETAAEVSRAVDQLFRNSFAETLTETEKAFQLSFISMTEAILTVIELVSLVVIVIIMAVSANTMAMSSRERAGEYAVFKTLGFGGRFLVLLIAGESLVISALGTGLGMALTFPAAGLFRTALDKFFPVFQVDPETMVLDVIAGLMIAGVSAVFPAWQAVRVRIADGLGRIG